MHLWRQLITQTKTTYLFQFSVMNELADSRTRRALLLLLWPFWFWFCHNLHTRTYKYNYALCAIWSNFGSSRSILAASNPSAGQRIACVTSNTRSVDCVPMCIRGASMLCDHDRTGSIVTYIQFAQEKTCARQCRTNATPQTTKNKFDGKRRRMDSHAILMTVRQEHCAVCIGMNHLGQMCVTQT